MLRESVLVIDEVGDNLAKYFVITFCSSFHSHKKRHVYVHQTHVSMTISFWEHQLSLHFMASVCIRLSLWGIFNEFQGLRMVVE